MCDSMSSIVLLFLSAGGIADKNSAATAIQGERETDSQTTATVQESCEELRFKKVVANECVTRGCRKTGIQ